MPGKWLGKAFLLFGIYLRVDWGRAWQQWQSCLMENRNPTLQALRGSKEAEKGRKRNQEATAQGPRVHQKVWIWSQSTRTMEFCKASSGLQSVPHSCCQAYIPDKH